MTINSAELAALAQHYATTVHEHTGTGCEIVRNMAGQYVAIYAPIGRSVPLGTTRDTAYSTLVALLSTVEHDQVPQ